VEELIGQMSTGIGIEEYVIGSNPTTAVDGTLITPLANVA